MNLVPLMMWGLRLFAVVMGAAHAAISIHDHMMNEDGISYLDLGDRYARGEWAPVSGVWSPLYPSLLGLAVRLAQPSPRWEFAVAHLVTLGIYLLALAAFEYFWRTSWRALRSGSVATATITFSEWAWWLSGYLLFVWSSVVLIRFRAVTPDMLVAGLAYLASGLLVQFAVTDRPVRAAGWLGGVLGLGYLAKAAMFPMGLVFLAAALALAWRSRQRRRAWLAAPLAFFVVVTPLVLVLSFQAGRPTIGEAGRVTYLKHVNGLPFPYDADALPQELGQPAHPIRLLHKSPTVFEFATPVPGTYPPGYDPSYWMDGLSARVQPLKQLRFLVGNVFWYADLFLRQLGGPVALVLVLLWMGREHLRTVWATPWALVLVGVGSAALAMYALVYVEGRYVAPFVLVVCAGMMALVRVTDSPHARRAIMMAGLLLPLLIGAELAAFDAPYVRRFLSPSGFSRERQMASGRPDAPWRVAEALRHMGVQPGDEVGFIGYGFGATFARLAKVRIVAEMPWAEAPRFWALDAAGRARVLQAFAGVGALVVISEVPPPAASADEWKELGGTGRYVRVVRTGS